ncbi:MAG: DMT family transporter [Alphaproteobacteria bacterium]|nr:DMT family transporter [Alphaproteobacteria bacterium]
MPKTDGKAVAYALLALTALFWSGNVVVGRAVAGEIPPFALTFWRWLLALGIAISLLGTTAILARGDIAVLGALDVTRGDLWMLAAAGSYALYTALLRLRPAGLDEMAFLFVIGAFGSLALVPFVIAETFLVGAMPLTRESLATVAYVAVFSSLLGYIFWNRGIVVVGADRGAMFLHLMPVFTAALGMIFLGEAPRPYHGLGMALIFAGLLLVTRHRPGREAADASPGTGAGSRAPGGRPD